MAEYSQSLWASADSEEGEEKPRKEVKMEF